MEKSKDEQKANGHPTPFSQTYFHGTKTDLKIGDFIEVGYNSNFGQRKNAKYIFLTATLDATNWGAELAFCDGHGQRLENMVVKTKTNSKLENNQGYSGSMLCIVGRDRIYLVEPTGLIEDDPDLTDKKFPGNPTKSYRSIYPFKVVGEITIWQGHPTEQVKAMKDALAKLNEQGINSLNE